MPVHRAVEPHIRSRRTANVRGTRSGKCGRSGCNRAGERNQVACVQCIAYKAPFDPFETIVKACFRDRVSSPNLEETPWAESLDPGLPILTIRCPMQSGRIHGLRSRFVLEKVIEGLVVDRSTSTTALVDDTTRVVMDPIRVWLG